MKTTIHEAKLQAEDYSDYRQFREQTAIQPISRNHPPSLKNPIKVQTDDKRKLSKAERRAILERARHQSGKPEIVNTTAFVPINQG